MSDFDSRLGRLPRSTIWSVLVAATLLGVAGGCAPPDINRSYGGRGAFSADSVNGTNVLGTMFEAAGHKVTTRRRLSPRLETFQTLVWFPDSCVPPSAAEREYFENWLSRGEGRTVVYVGRDYDAAIEYWRRIRATAPPDQYRQIDVRMNNAVDEYQIKRSTLPKEQYVRWFVVRSDKPAYRVESLAGPWADGVDGAKAQIDVAARFAASTDDDRSRAKAPPPPSPSAPLALPKTTKQRRSSRRRDDPEYLRPAPVELPFLPDCEVLLSTDKGDPLVMRLTQDEPKSIGNSWFDSQLLVVTNGAFLVNLGLVNHEHRKLAERLIEACGPAGKVAFLESDSSGLEILDREPDQNKATGFELFTIFPLNAILLHLVAAGILICFVRMPIFGRPRNLPQPSTADFGAHITAAGKLLSKSGDPGFARQKLEQYRQLTKATSTGRRPVSAPPPAAVPESNTSVSTS